jgi:hypothetical protein
VRALTVQPGQANSLRLRLITRVVPLRTWEAAFRREPFDVKTVIDCESAS